MKPLDQRQGLEIDRPHFGRAVDARSGHIAFQNGVHDPTLNVVRPSVRFVMDDL
jgi:hypothetical protein